MAVASGFVLLADINSYSFVFITRRSMPPALTLLQTCSDALASKLLRCEQKLSRQCSDPYNHEQLETLHSVWSPKKYQRPTQLQRYLKAKMAWGRQVTYHPETATYRQCCLICKDKIRSAGMLRPTVPIQIFLGAKGGFRRMIGGKGPEVSPVTCRKGSFDSIGRVGSGIGIRETRTGCCPNYAASAKHVKEASPYWF